MKREWLHLLCPPRYAFGFDFRLCLAFLSLKENNKNTKPRSGTNSF